MFVAFTFWIDWDVYQLMFSSITIYRYILIFTFPFDWDWDFYQLIFFSMSKYTFYFFYLIEIFINLCFPQWHLRINTNFHFSFPFRLIFLSIDFFLNQSIHLRPTYYFSLFLSSRIDIVINWYFSQSLNTDICNFI